MDPSPLCIMESSEHLEQLKAHYSIKEVVQTGKQVGHGAYGYVEEVEVSVPRDFPSWTPVHYA